MKRKLAIIMSAMLMASIIPVIPVSAAKNTYKYISSEITTKTLSARKVRISWKKHKADKYIIYKYVFTKSGSSKLKKLKTVSGKKTSTVIKAGKNEYLHLYVKGISKKTRTKYVGDAVCWSGVATPDWDDYSYAESKCSPTFIELEVLGGGGMTPDGYKIYRKVEGGKSYKFIKKIKTKKKYLTWRDTTVKTGKGYYYKVSSYRKTGKKILRSKKSYSILRYAVNYGGKYQVTADKVDGQTTIKLTSDTKNGETVFRLYEFYYAVMLAEEEGHYYKLTEYSLDGETWKTITDSSAKIRIAAGKSIMFHMTEKTYDPDSDDMEEYYQGIFVISCIYRGVPSFINLPAQNDSIESYQDSESIH